MSSKKPAPTTEKTAKPKKEAEAVAAPVKIPKGGLNSVNLPIESIKIKKGFNPRTDLGDLTKLKRNIKQHGLISPVTVCPTSPGADTYYIIAGGRRHAAMGELGKSIIAAVIRDIDINSPEAFQIAISENSDEARTPLGPEDQTAAFQKLLDGFGGEGHEAEVANVAGVDPITVKRALRYGAVPEEVKAKVRDGAFGRRVATAIMDVPEEVRAKVASRMSDGTTENDVRIMANEEKARLRKDGKALPAAPTTRKGTLSRHNVPFGAEPGVTAVERGQRQQTDMRKKLTSLILNLEADVEEATNKEDKATAGAKLQTAQAALAALYWVAGITAELIETTSATSAEVAVDAKDFIAALARGKETVEEAQREKEAADTAPKAKPEKKAAKAAPEKKAKPEKKVAKAKPEPKAEKKEPKTEKKPRPVADADDDAPPAAKAKAAGSDDDNGEE